MDYDSSKNDQRTDADQSEIAPGIRVIFESPVCEILSTAIKSVKVGRPFWPRGETVYFLGAAEGYVKIGYTTNLTSRVCDIQVANPLPLRVLAYVPAYRSVELAYHRRFASARLHGEWFRLTPEIQAEIDELNEEMKAA